MNQTTAHSHESQFAPPSQLVDIQDFERKCLQSVEKSRSIVNWQEYTDISAEQKAAIETEYDIRLSLTKVFHDQALYAHVIKSHDDRILDIALAVRPKAGTSTTTKKRKRMAEAAESQTDSEEVMQLRKTLDSIQLQSWPYTAAAAAFVRSPKYSDINVLHKVRKTPKPDASIECLSEKPALGALIIVSVCNRLSWGNHLSRFSQHAVLASQTLGDLYEAIPCPSNEIPSEHLQDEVFAGYQEKTSEHRGAVMCIENIAFGDGQSEEDYSDKLLKHIDSMPVTRRPSIKKGPGMHEQTFASLPIRINKPYWLLHQGSCEHFLVVDQISLAHSADPHDGYPLTLRVTPTILDICQACSKVPAVWSVIGDVRLGQSPCLLCAPCLRHMGELGRQESVVVIPLPKYPSVHA